MTPLKHSQHHIFKTSCAYAIVCLGLSGQVQAQHLDLNTRAEQTLGVTVMRYKYDEPGYMQLKANKLGFFWSGTQVFGTSWPDPGASWFLRAELDAFFGGAEYDSPISGQLANTPHRFWEARALAGKDFSLGAYVLSPYVGVGYRVLNSNIGYQRDSFYTTLPIGINHKFKLADRSILITGIEYMALIKGQQKVKLPIQDVTLEQRKGHGLRLSMALRDKSWSLGPTLTYWRLAASEVGGAVPVLEPQNTTTELGLRLQYHY